MAQPSWAPKRKAGESESAYKKRYYTAQRQDAEKNKSGSTYKSLQKKGYEPSDKQKAKPAAKAAASKDPAADYMKSHGAGSQQPKGKPATRGINLSNPVSRLLTGGSSPDRSKTPKDYKYNPKTKKVESS